MVSSTDGYCSIIQFEEGELGEIYDQQLTKKIEESVEKKEVEPEQKASREPPKPLLELDSNAVDIDISNTKLHPPQQENVSLQNEKLETEMEVDEPVTKKDGDETEDFELILEDTIMDSSNPNVKSTPTKSEKPNIFSARTPRRVQLITISSPKRTKVE